MCREEFFYLDVSKCLKGDCYTELLSRWKGSADSLVTVQGEAGGRNKATAMNICISHTTKAPDEDLGF